MRIQAIIPTDAASANDRVLSYMAARFLVRNDMPISGVINKISRGGLRLIARAGLEDNDVAPEDTVEQYLDTFAPEHGQEGQFLIAGCSRGAEDLWHGVAALYNHQQVRRNVGDVTIVYVACPGLRDDAYDALEHIRSVPGIVVNVVDVRGLEEQFIADVERGTRFAVDQGTLTESLDIMLRDLVDMDIAYSQPT